MFLEQVYRNLCDRLNLDPAVDLTTAYVDSALYQRLIISETIIILLSLDEIHLNLVNSDLQEACDTLIALEEPEQVGFEQSLEEEDDSNRRIIESNDVFDVEEVGSDFDNVFLEDPYDDE